jgi:hypothetical protein
MNLTTNWTVILMCALTPLDTHDHRTNRESKSTLEPKPD